jgi:hypothetical protein
LKDHPQDSTKKIWDFHRGDTRYVIPASDTSYLGFTDLFEAPDSILVSYDDFFILQTDSNAVDSIEISVPEMLREAPKEPEIIPFESIPTEDPIEIPEQIEVQDSTSIRKE